MSTRQDQIIRFGIEVVNNKELLAIAQNLEAIAKAGGDAAPEAQKLLDELTNIAKLGSQATGLAGLRAQLHETGDALALAKIKAAELQAQFDKAGAPTAALTKQLTAAKNSVAALEAQFNAQTAGITKTENALAAAGISTKNLDAAQRQIAQSLTNTAAAGAEFAAKVGNAAKETEKAVGVFGRLREIGGHVGESLKTAGEHALEFGKHLLEISGVAAVVTSALAALTGERLFEKGLEQADKFEEAITKVGIATGTTGEKLEKLGQSAKDAAEKTGVSGTEAAEALLRLAKGAGSAEAAVAQLQPTLVLAQAAQINAAQAADILSTALAEFGLQATDSQRVIDLFAKTASVSKSDLADLSDSFGKIAPDAKAAGASIEETAALLAALADNGVRGKKATADLQQVFQQLADTSSPLSKKLFDLGLNGQDLSTVLQKLSGNSQLAESVFRALGTTGSSALRALVSAAPDLQRVSGLIKDNAGAAQTLADTLDKELGGAFEQFKAAFNDAAREFSEPLLKPLAEQFAAAREQIISFTKSADFKNIAQSIANFVSGAVKSLREFFANIDFSKAAKSISDFTGSANDSFKSFSSGLSGVGAVASAVSNSVALVFHTLQGVIGAVVSSSAEFVARAADVIFIAKKVTGASAEALQAAKDQADNLHRTAEELKQRTTEAFQAAGKNIENLATAINKSGAESGKAAPQIKAVGEAAKESAEGHNAAAAAAEKHGEAVAGLPPKLKIFGDSTGEATKHTKELNQALGDLDLIKLQSEFKSTADGAVRAFELIVKAQQSGVLSVEDVRRAYASMAAKIREAAEFGDAEAKQRAEDLIAEKGLLVDLGDSYDHLAAQQRHAAEAADIAAANASTAASIAADRMAAAADKAKNWGTETERAAGALESAASDGGASLAKLDEALANTRAGFLSISEAAAKAFDSRLVGDFFSAFDSTGIGFARVIQGMNEAAAATTKEIEQQRTALAQEIAGIDELGAAGQTNFGAFGDAAGGAAERMRGLADLIAQGKYQMGLLGQQDLGPLQQALEAAAARADQLAQAASNAVQSIADKARAAQDEIDQLLGNQTGIEDRRHEKAIRDIQEEAKIGGASAARAAEDAINKENQLHALKIKNLQEQQKKASGDSGSGGGSPSPSPTPSGGGGGRVFFGNDSPVTVNVHLDAGVVATEEGLNKLAAKITRPVIKEIGNIHSRTVGPIDNVFK
jgi:TP901 family phage tail tape measure protein